MADRFGYGEIGLDINPCRECEDYEEPNGCKSNGGCGGPTMNDDYISRAVAIKTVCGDCEYYATNDCEDCRMDRLTKLTPADVRPVVKAKWHIIETCFGGLVFDCSACAYIATEYTKHCPNCGADMMGGADG